MVRKTKALGSCTRMWKLENGAYIWMVAPQCHLICTNNIGDLERVLRGDYAISRLVG
jgi:hypothetical protein